METRIFTFYPGDWKCVTLIFYLLFNGCQNSDTTNYRCAENYFTFSIDGITRESNENNKFLLTWKYQSEVATQEECDITFHNGYEIIACDCVDLFEEEDDVHFITFFFGATLHQNNLQVIIRRQEADLIGHHIRSRLYYLNKKNRPEDAIVAHLTFTDKQNGMLYESINGSLTITHFTFNQCIEGKIRSVLQNPDGETITVSGTFRANFDG